MAGSFKKRAERGFNFLSELIPDWKERIDIDKLDQSSETDDVLGQLFGDFTTGYTMICNLYRDKHKLSEGALIQEVPWWKWITDNGFAIYQEPDPETGTYCSPRSPTLRKRYAALTQAWKDLLRAPD